jgi:hypothetical protein
VLVRGLIGVMNEGPGCPWARLPRVAAWWSHAGLHDMHCSAEVRVPLEKVHALSGWVKQGGTAVA